jgi:Flp pilus assembly pilin Flp
MPSRLPPIIHRLAGSRRGVTVIEYAVLAAPISIAAAAMLSTVGLTIQNLLAPASGAMS